jgi:hypothetical protein
MKFLKEDRSYSSHDILKLSLNSNQQVDADKSKGEADASPTF